MNWLKLHWRFIRNPKLHWRTGQLRPEVGRYRAWDGALYDFRRVSGSDVGRLEKTDA
jgi:hypothetical protein